MRFVRSVVIAIAMVLFSLAVAAPGQKPDAPKSGKTATPHSELIDINSASVAELKTLPGIGDAHSRAIVKHRPYKNKTQLRSMGVIPPAAYNKIKDQIIARQ
jgi:competence protein ComEA